MGRLPDLLRGDCDGDVIEWGAENDRYLDEDGERITYQDWHPSTSRVVSGPYGLNKFPGRWFPDRFLARRYWMLRGRILEEYFIAGRWIFRIATQLTNTPSAGAVASRLEGDTRVRGNPG